MSRELKIDLLARVEGSGGIEVVLDKNEVKDVKMPIYEGPRFFESIIKTVKYDKVPDIMRRICGICTASHSLCSIRAIENAFQIEATTQTLLLRDLLIHGEMIESHALHTFMLALPDYLGFHDAIRMASKYPKEVEAALQLKKAGNMVHNLVSGREVHGMNERVGGFSKVPSEKDLLKIRKAMEQNKYAAELAVNLFSSIDLPKFSESNNTLIALYPDKKYGFISDTVAISDGSRNPIDRYLEFTNEVTVPYSTAKSASYKNKPFMVGALPRLILNKEKLAGSAKELYDKSKGLIKQNNCLTNNLAQAIELVHSVDRCIEDIDELIDMGIKKENIIELKPKKGRGVGAVEAPRGILYHDYEFDENGKVLKANVITPTAQNIANMEKDYRIAADNLIEESDDKLINAFELIARAYDPCISCSVHMVRLNK